MKKKTLFASLLLILCIDSAQAQSNVKAIGAALDTIMRTYTRDDVIDRIVGQVYSRQPSAQLAARIGKAYFRYFEDTSTGERIAYKTDSARAFRFVREAIRLDPTYAPAYVLAGDICAYYAKKDEALAWLDAGIKANPTDSTLYKASSEVLFKVGMSEALEAQRQGRQKTIDMYKPAIERLEKIREQDPTYPIDLELGRLYFQIYRLGGLTPWVQIAESYGRADRKSLTKGDLQAYALALRQSNQFSTGVELTEYALKQYKNDHSLNESHLHCAIGLAHAEAEQDRQKKSADRNPERIVQLYKNAVAAAEQFFAVGLKERFNSTNYLWYGEALNGAKEYEKALEVYDNILKRPDLEKKSERLAYGHIATTMEDKANDYIKAGDYANAVKVYEEFIQQRKAINRYDASMVSMLAKIYMSWAKKLDGQDQLDKYKAAETVYDQMAIDFPEYAELALWNKITVRLESKPKWNEEEPYDYLPALAENLSALLLSKGELTSEQKVRLAYSYFLLCFYNATNLKKGNKKLAIDYANKVLEIDPTHPGAAKVLEILTKKK